MRSKIWKETDPATSLPKTPTNENQATWIIWYTTYLKDWIVGACAPSQLTTRIIDLSWVLATSTGPMSSTWLTMLRRPIVSCWSRFWLTNMVKFLTWRRRHTTWILWLAAPGLLLMARAKSVCSRCLSNLRRLTQSSNMWVQLKCSDSSRRKQQMSMITNMMTLCSAFSGKIQKYRKKAKSPRSWWPAIHKPSSCGIFKQKS